MTKCARILANRMRLARKLAIKPLLNLVEPVERLPVSRVCVVAQPIVRVKVLSKICVEEDTCLHLLEFGGAGTNVSVLNSADTPCVLRLRLPVFRPSL
ncbi:hypothetical protein T265_09268 [Opisthorchis viverrini]|uniref:Uncharacterized protein n=1 Tax=Opisthorchis viverrini TaxID=6198 RepID=A0A074ZAZ6_OPIVI|nr:hypothetical protein T265_09268 [Opisthorchis viverrini]KER22707.1 hypothetical protein T265_09268 [Opisthorchis viverrini]